MSSLGTTIRWMRKARGLTLNQLASLVESDVGNLSRLERGVQGASLPLLERIAEALHTTVGVIFDGVEENLNARERFNNGVAQTHAPYSVDVPAPEDDRFYHIKRVKLHLSAGLTGFQTEQDPDELTLPLRRDWVDAKNFDPSRLVAIKIKGESMEPSLFEDDIVVVNTADTKLVDGAVFAINYEGEAVIKRLERDLGQWWLSSDNPDKRRYPRKMCVNGDCIIVGRIVRKESERI